MENHTQFAPNDPKYRMELTKDPIGDTASLILSYQRLQDFQNILKAAQSLKTHRREVGDKTLNSLRQKFENATFDYRINYHSFELSFLECRGLKSALEGVTKHRNEFHNTLLSDSEAMLLISDDFNRQCEKAYNEQCEKAYQHKQRPAREPSQTQTLSMAS